jgi:4-methyl-5(b-hydroxyethyl)-thiazole monophosphate biosynthesis
LAEGFEEVEAVTPIDYLRRAGVEVTTAQVEGDSMIVSGAHNIPLVTDTILERLAKRTSAAAWDAVLLPGGAPGAVNLADSQETGPLLREMAAAGKLICAICASPAVVLAPLGLLAGKRFTCFPGMEKNIQGAFWTDDPVVVDGNLVTSRGAGTAGLWAVEIIGLLLSPGEGEKVARSVLL